MKLFLSWSGDQSRAAAEAVRGWIRYVINAVEPWMSKPDIDAGARWNAALQGKLEESRFGVLFVTRDNMTAPWLLFEAGALAKTSQDTYVCPYLIGLEPQELTGPLSQFQAQVADEEGTLALLKTINRALDSGSRLSDEHIEKAFKKQYSDLKDKLDALPTAQTEKSPRRDPDDMIREVLAIVRRLDQKESAGRLPGDVLRAVFQQAMGEPSNIVHPLPASYSASSTSSLSRSCSESVESGSSESSSSTT